MSFIVSVIFSFFYGWKLTLVILSCAPLIILSTAFVSKMQASLTKKELKAYSKAGSVAEEVLGSIRTVVAFGGEKKELERYSNRLIPAEKNGRKKGVYSGIGGGFMWLIIYCCYALAVRVYKILEKFIPIIFYTFQFWYGISLILEDRGKVDKEYTPAVLIIVVRSLHNFIGFVKFIGLILAIWSVSWCTKLGFNCSTSRSLLHCNGVRRINIQYH